MNLTASSQSNKEALAAAAVTAAGPVPTNEKEQALWIARKDFAFREGLSLLTDHAGPSPEKLAELSTFREGPDKLPKRRIFVGRLLGAVHIDDYPRAKVGLATSYGEVRNWDFDKALAFYKKHRTDPGATDYKEGSLDVVGIKEFNTPMKNSREGIEIIRAVSAHTGAMVEIYKDLESVKVQEKSLDIRVIFHIEPLGIVTDDMFQFKSESASSWSQNDTSDTEDDFGSYFDDDDSNADPEIKDFASLVAAVTALGVGKADFKQAIENAGYNGKAELDSDPLACFDLYQTLKKSA